MLTICYNTGMEHSLISDFNQLQQFIKNEKLNGADITLIMDDIHHHWEIASSFNWANSKGYYSDLLTRLIKTYGH